MTERIPHGIIPHKTSERKTDYLYRISIKAVVFNDKGEVLVVKESDRDWWDLPGGGMDHGEDFKTAIARELKEEVNMIDDFQFRIVEVENPAYLAELNFWQMRMIFAVIPENMSFSPGEDGDEVAFYPPSHFEKSDSKTERRVHEYSTKAICSS